MAITASKTKTGSTYSSKKEKLFIECEEGKEEGLIYLPPGII